MKNKIRTTHWAIYAVIFFISDYIFDRTDLPISTYDILIIVASFNIIYLCYKDLIPNKAKIDLKFDIYLFLFLCALVTGVVLIMVGWREPFVFARESRENMFSLIHTPTHGYSLIVLGLTFIIAGPRLILKEKGS